MADSNLLETPWVRLSYPTLFKARSFRLKDGSMSEPTFGAQLHFDAMTKRDPKYKELMDKLWGAVNELAKERFPREFNRAKQPWLDGSRLHSPWLNPLDPDYSDKADLAGVERFIRCNSNQPIPCVSGALEPITDPKILYPGCYVKAKLILYDYNVTGNFGVGFGLRAIQFVRPGTPLAGVVDATKAFEALDDPEEEPFEGNASEEVNKIYA